MIGKLKHENIIHKSMRTSSCRSIDVHELNHAISTAPGRIKFLEFAQGQKETRLKLDVSFMVSHCREWDKCQHVSFCVTHRL